MKKVLSVFLVLTLLLCNYSITANANELNIPASAAIVVNAKTGAVIYAKNATTQLPMASTTKIMTAILLIENANLDSQITTTREMVTVEGSSMGLLEGDKATYRSLLYGMMLPSGNDAATTVAISLASSLQNFSLMMNKKAKELSMHNTNFVTPSGLDHKYHFSTVEDMAKLSVYAMKNPEFRKVVSTKKIRVEYGNPPYSRMLYGHNKILNTYDGANGIKTGYTSKSGKCLVSSAKRGNMEVIAVTLNDSHTQTSHKTLLDYGFSKLNEVELKLPNNIQKTEVISGSNKYVQLVSNTKNVALTASETENLNYKISIKPFVYAPVPKGQTVGRVDFYVGNTFLESLDIKTFKSVKLKKQTKQTFLKRLLQYITLFI